MTNKSAPVRLSQNPEARERLREAQRIESVTLGSVYVAEQRLARSEAKREAAIAAADAAVEQARRELGSAQHELIVVSGLARAAQLLGQSRSALRRSASGRTSPDA